ncbi:hypothetical protein THIX_30498 [Thiomonas sp. X19]|nr:hypothetical protein THIX_30498 [Thiomonas sp. X19]
MALRRTVQCGNASLPVPIEISGMGGRLEAAHKAPPPHPTPPHAWGGVGFGLPRIWQTSIGPAEMLLVWDGLDSCAGEAGQTCRRQAPASPMNRHVQPMR